MLDQSAQYDSKYDLAGTLGSEHSCQGQAQSEEAEIEIYGSKSILNKYC